jgi:threonine dehydrogenase-like Zn-dependent dehydrogenase
MKAAVYYRPHHLEVEQKNLREIGDEELLVKVSACGICGTDVHIVEGTARSNPPVVLGHEFCGVVEQVGRAAPGFALGNMVAVDPNIFCGRCYYCQRGLIHLCSGLRALGVDGDGGLAEYCIVPYKQVHPLPSDLPLEASAFVEPISCAIHGIDKANIQLGDIVVILGGGTIGLIMIQLVKLAGASKIIVVEPLEQKRKIAERVGADILLNPDEVEVLSAVKDIATEGADVVIECVGKPLTTKLSVALARRGGTAEFFGVCPKGEMIPIEPNEVYFKDMTIVGSYVNPFTFARAIALLANRKVSVEHFSIHRFNLDGIDEALRYQRDGLTIKSLVLPNG